MGKNNVWAELRKTARHERKGEKRRRLQSERWRRRFKEEVRTSRILLPYHLNQSNEIAPFRFEKECRWCWKFAVAARSPCCLRVSVRVPRILSLQVTYIAHQIIVLWRIVAWDASIHHGLRVLCTFQRPSVPIVAPFANVRHDSFIVGVFLLVMCRK